MIELGRPPLTSIGLLQLGPQLLEEQLLTSSIPDRLEQEEHRTQEEAALDGEVEQPIVGVYPMEIPSTETEEKEARGQRRRCSGRLHLSGPVAKGKKDRAEGE